MKINLPAPSCPVLLVQVNEFKVRAVAFQVVILISVFLVSQTAFIPLFLCIDFYIRGFTVSSFSPLGKAASWLVSKLQMPVKLTDEAPKKFAAKVGFVFTFSISMLAFLQAGVASVVLAGILLVFALLESVFRFCAGCFVYIYFYVPVLSRISSVFRRLKI